MLEVELLRARTHKIWLAFARGLCARVLGLVGAECLRAIYGVLWRHEHADGIVDGEDGEREHDGGDEQRLGGSSAAADLEDADPEEADADGGDARDGAAKEKEDQQRHEDIVDGKDAGELDKDPVEGLEDVNVTEDVAAALLAYRVFGLVDARDEHGYPYKQRGGQEKDAAEHLEWPQ